MMETVLEVFFVLYCLQALGVLIGNVMNRTRITIVTKELPVSIVVAARNEEKNLRACLESLLSQNYCNYEIILVDDRSTDKTGQIVLEMASKAPRLVLLRIDQNRSLLTGKQNALHQGILQSKGEIILLTDADCIAVPSWVRRMVQALSRGNNLVFGITRVGPLERFWNKFEALELNFLFTVAIGMARLGFAGSCMGNNLAFKKESYFKVGGYPAMGIQPTEDFALLQKFSEARMCWTVESSTPTITTKASETFAQWFHQQMRWLGGSLSLKNGLTWALIPLILVNMGAPLWLIFKNPPLLFVYIFIVKILFDLILISWRASPGFVLLIPGGLIFYILATPIYLILFMTVRKVSWKGEQIKFYS